MMPFHTKATMHKVSMWFTCETWKVISSPCVMFHPTCRRICNGLAKFARLTWLTSGEHRGHKLLGDDPAHWPQKNTLSLMHHKASWDCVSHSADASLKKNLMSSLKANVKLTISKFNFVSQMFSFHFSFWLIRTSHQFYASSQNSPWSPQNSNWSGP